MALALIPNPGQNLNDTRADIRGNFVTIQADFGVNHLPYGAVNEGKHNCVTLPIDHSISGTNNLPATNSSECLIYSAAGPVSGNPELFFQRQSQGVATGYTFTESTAATNGWTRLPSGILIKWGLVPAPISPTPFTVTFPAGGSIPIFSQIFTVMISPQEANGVTSPFDHVLVTQLVTTTGFRINCHDNISSTISVNYLAIGI